MSQAGNLSIMMEKIKSKSGLVFFSLKTITEEFKFVFLFSQNVIKPLI